MANRYWVGGTASWDGTAGTKWATTSGGAGGASVPTSADDVFFDVNSTGTVTIASGNTGAKSLNCTGFVGSLGGSSPITISGSITLSPAMNVAAWSGAVTIDGTGVITQNGKFFTSLTISGSGIEVSLGGDLIVLFGLNLSMGSFDAASYNVTLGSFISTTSNQRTLKMGSGLWTLTSFSSVWQISNLTTSSLNFYKGSANILLSNNTSSSRQFIGGGLSYNKLTIGGNTSTSTTSIQDNNQFTEIASTKTVAHTVAFGSTNQTFGKWSISGSPGNVVSLTNTFSTNHVLAGAATSGIDYLDIGLFRFSSQSPGEFYAGANSVASGAVAAPNYLTAPPSPRTLYWVGGAGNWDNTARWSTSSGGPGGAAIPNSLDSVVFNSASNATSYTSTINSTSRCGSLTISGPASGSVTLAGSSPIFVHASASFPASGMIRTYVGQITLSGSSSGNVFATGGIALTGSQLNVNGVGSQWSLGGNLDLGSGGSVNVVNGSLSFASYNVLAAAILSNNSNTRSIDLGSGTITLSANTAINFGTTAIAPNLTFSGGSSQVNLSSASAAIAAFDGVAFNNVTFTSSGLSTPSITGPNTFNNLTVTGRFGLGVSNFVLASNQVILGTFACLAGTDATGRIFVRSDAIGTTRTLTCAAVSLTDVDFRDIGIAGAAAPATGARLGDCKGNSGITFAAAANKYWNLSSGGVWSATAWATSSGGSPAVNNFPLAQDTCIFEATGLNSGSTVTLNEEYAIGSIDMSARTSNTMTFATGGNKPFVYGNWTNGSGSTVTGTQLRFGGRTAQSITSAGKTFPHSFYIEAPNTSVVMQDNFSAQDMFLTAASVSLDANNKNITLNASLSATSATSKTLAFGSGVWSIGSSWSVSLPCVVTGDGTIKMTSATFKTFAGGGVSYGNVCLEQSGNGQLSITGNNTFRNIQSSATGANTISMTGTTQSLSGTWTARGSAGNLLTISGGALVKTTPGVAANVNYVNINGNSASPSGLWYAGPNSVNTSSSGWVFQAAPTSANFFMFYGG